MTHEQVDAMPLYLAAIRMGAMSPDHANLQMTEADVRRYPGMKKWRRFSK